MQFTVLAVFAAFVASVAATPVARQTSCDFFGCLTASETTVQTCLPAIEGGFADISADFQCITGLISVFKNPAPECSVCLDEIKGIFGGSTKKL